MIKKTVSAIALLLCLAFVLGSCRSDSGSGINEYATTEKQAQSFTEANEPGTTLPAVPSASQNASAADNSWQNNYTLTYTYTENGTMSELTEMRCEGLYMVTDNASGAVSCFLQNGSDIDQYVLNPAAKTGTHTLLKDKSLANITTGFMKIAAIDPSFTSQSNVEYQNEESVAGRTAKKYTQSAYSSAGLLTAYAFVWIDSQYGFASRCQVYNMTGTVNTSWELQELTVGGVTLQSAGFSTDGYQITESTSES